MSFLLPGHETKEGRLEARPPTPAPPPCSSDSNTSASGGARASPYAQNQSVALLQQQAHANKRYSRSSHSSQPHASTSKANDAATYTPSNGSPNVTLPFQLNLEYDDLPYTQWPRQNGHSGNTGTPSSRYSSLSASTSSHRSNPAPPLDLTYRTPASGPSSANHSEQASIASSSHSTPAPNRESALASALAALRHEAKSPSASSDDTIKPAPYIPPRNQPQQRTLDAQSEKSQPQASTSKVTQDNVPMKVGVPAARSNPWDKWEAKKPPPETMPPEFKFTAATDSDFLLPDTYSVDGNPGDFTDDDSDEDDDEDDDEEEEDSEGDRQTRPGPALAHPISAFPPSKNLWVNNLDPRIHFPPRSRPYAYAYPPQPAQPLPYPAADTSFYPYGMHPYLPHHLDMPAGRFVRPPPPRRRRAYSRAAELPSQYYEQPHYNDFGGQPIVLRDRAYEYPRVMQALPIATDVIIPEVTKNHYSRAPEYIRGRRGSSAAFTERPLLHDNGNLGPVYHHPHEREYYPMQPAGRRPDRTSHRSISTPALRQFQFPAQPIPPPASYRPSPLNPYESCGPDPDFPEPMAGPPPRLPPLGLLSTPSDNQRDYPRSPGYPHSPNHHVKNRLQVTKPITRSTPLFNSAFSHPHYGQAHMPPATQSSAPAVHNGTSPSSYSPYDIPTSSTYHDEAYEHAMDARRRRPEHHRRRSRSAAPPDGFYHSVFY